MIKTDSDILREALNNMVASLIASLPIDKIIPELYMIAIKFIGTVMQAGRIDATTMDLWHFIAKDYSSDQGLDKEMIQLFQVSFYYLLIRLFRSIICSTLYKGRS